MCMCDSDSVYVCMGVICVHKHKEQRSNEHTSSQELWLLLTLQYNVSLSSHWPPHWPRLMNFLNPQSCPWTSHCPLTLCKQNPCEWKKRVITHAQMYTHIHVYTLYTNTCTNTRTYTQQMHTHYSMYMYLHTHKYSNTSTQHMHTHHTHTRMHKPLLALSSIDSSSLLFSVQLVVQLIALLV